jgi:hypothetical protein
MAYSGGVAMHGVGFPTSFSMSSRDSPAVLAVFWFRRNNASRGLSSVFHFVFDSIPKFISA